MAYTWDGTQYVDDAGDPVDDAAVQAALAAIQAAASEQVAALAQRVTDGSLRPTLWERNVAGVLRNASLSAAALAAGGWANLDDHEDDVVGRLTTQLQYLGQMRAQVPSLSPAQVAARSLLYVGAVGTIFAAVSRTVARRQAGVQQCRNMLDAGARHCDECPDLTDQGWMPVDDMPLPGERACVGNCRCTLVYRTVNAADEDAA